MSSSETVSVRCPRCGTQQPTTLWHSLNVTLDPDEKRTLFDGEINRFTCQKCGASAPLDAPFMYHDMERQFVAHYVPPSLLSDPSLPQTFDENGAQRMPEGLPPELMPEYFRTPHIVFSMEELVRYVIFREWFPPTHVSGR